MTDNRKPQKDADKLQNVSRETIEEGVESTLSPLEAEVDNTGSAEDMTTEELDRAMDACSLEIKASISRMYSILKPAPKHIQPSIQLKAHIANQGANCYHCGSILIVGSNLEHSDGAYRQLMTCTDCGKTYVDSYHLSNVIE